MTPSFTYSPTEHAVFWGTDRLRDEQRIEDLLTFFQTREAEAVKAAAEARKAFNALWDARCAAYDARARARRAPERSVPAREGE